MSEQEIKGLFLAYDGITKYYSYKGLKEAYNMSWQDTTWLYKKYEGEDPKEINLFIVSSALGIERDALLILVAYCVKNSYSKKELLKFYTYLKLASKLGVVTSDVVTSFLISSHSLAEMVLSLAAANDLNKIYDNIIIKLQNILSTMEREIAVLDEENRELLLNILDGIEFEISMSSSVSLSEEDIVSHYEDLAPEIRKNNRRNNFNGKIIGETKSGRRY